MCTQGGVFVMSHIKIHVGRQKSNGKILKCKHLLVVLDLKLFYFTVNYLLLTHDAVGQMRYLIHDGTAVVN